MKILIMLKITIVLNYVGKQEFHQRHFHVFIVSQRPPFYYTKAILHENRPCVASLAATKVAPIPLMSPSIVAAVCRLLSRQHSTAANTSSIM